MKTFYDKLKSKFSSPPKEAPDWDMWDKISSQIDPPSKRSVLPFWWWMPIAVLGSFFIGFLSNGKSTSIENTLASTATDTIYIEKELMRVDTIYKTRIVTRWERNDKQSQNLSELALINEEQSKKLDELNNINESLKKEQLIIAQKFEHFKNAINKSSFGKSPEYITMFTEKAQSSEEEEKRVNLSTNSLPIAIDKLNKEFNFNSLELKPFVLTKSVPSFMERITPDYYNVGLSADMPSFTNSSNFGQSNSLGGGANISLVFSSKIQFETGFWIKKIEQNTEKLEIASLYPQPSAIDIDAEFEGMSLLTNLYEFPALLKYNTWANEKIKTYGKAGIILTKTNHQDFKFNYKKGEEEIIYEVEGLEHKFNFKRIYLGYGFETRSWNGFSVFAEPYYIFDLNSSSNLLYKFDQFGLRFGAYYEL